MTASLGPAYSANDVRKSLEEVGAPFKGISDPAACAGQIIGWYQGRMEYGARALGHRSILADPRIAEMKDRVNAVVKFREGFRPFAPSVAEEAANQFFVNGHAAPYMTFTSMCDKIWVPPFLQLLTLTAQLEFRRCLSPSNQPTTRY
jgi:carbamoyltransferase